ncbi:MAG: beta strand repeat-containing protein, partial [Bacillota bacterium]
TVVSDIDAGTSGQTVGVSLTGLNVNVDLKSTMPVAGGTQTIATATLARVTVGSVTPTTSTVNAGTSSYTVFSAPLTIGTRDVYLKGLTLKMIGSIPTDALENIQLYVNGVAAGNATVIDSDNMVRFNLTTPVTMRSGTIEVRANIVKGSSRNFSFSLENAADLVVVDSVYNVNILATGIPASTGIITIAAGSVSVTTDPTFDTTTITAGASNVTLAKYNFKAFGEDVKVNYLKVKSSQTLDNMAIYVNGASATSNRNVTANTPENFSLGSSLIVPANTTVSVEIRGDTKSGGTPVGGDIEITLVKYGSNNAQGVSSSQLIEVPSADISSQTLTVGAGTAVIAVSSTFPSGNITPNTANQKIGSYVIQAGDSEAIRINNIRVELEATNINNLSNLYIKYGSSQSTPVNPQAINNFPVTIEVAKNQSLTVDVYADVGNAIDTGSDLSVSKSDTLGTDGTAATSQVTTLTLVPVSGQTYNVTINGTLYSTAGTGNATNDASTLAAAINSDGSNGVSASASSAVITITAVTSGATGFTVVATPVIIGVSTTPGTGAVAATPRVVDITLSGTNLKIGDEVTINIGGTSYTTTVSSPSNLTIAQLAADLASKANAHASFAAVPSTGVVRLTSAAGTGANSIDITVDVKKASGSVQTKLGVSATGVSSNTTIAITEKPGQLMSIKNPTLNTPTLVASSSPASQYVLAKTEQVVANYNFRATDGAVTIKEIEFTIANPETITSITVGGVTKEVYGSPVNVTGLNIPVPATYSGASIPVKVTYNTVGFGGGANSNTTSQVSISKVKYSAGNMTLTKTGLSVPANQMTIVGGLPMVDLNASTRSGLSAGTTLLAEVTVSALSNGGPIQVKELPLKISATNVTFSGNFSVEVGTQTIGVTALPAAAAGDKTITFTDPYTINPGDSVKFEIYATTALVTGTTDHSITTELGDRSAFNWNDVHGNVGPLDAALIPNYSTNKTSTIRDY